MSAPIKRVAFIGIGNMGWPMAARLVQGGVHVAVSDATPDRADLFAKEIGGEAAHDLVQAVGQADAIVTMLPTSQHVERVLGVIDSALRKGQIIIDMTSGLPATTRRLAETLAPRGIALVDAPVSGGVSRARTGELAIMTGGDADALDRADPLLKAMGTIIHCIGGVGAGQAMKALNNLVSAGGFLMALEALIIGQRFGLDPAIMTDALNASTGMNNSTQKKLKQFVLSRSFDSGFGLDLMVKDLTIALDVGRDGAVPTPFSALCREMWASAAAMLGQGQDHTAIAKLSEALAGEVLGGAKRRD